MNKDIWLQQWHGLYAKKSYGNVGQGFPKPGTESHLEVSQILSAIENVEAPRMMELGAGWGRQTLTVAGVKGRGTFYAVEAEPTHYQWLQETMAFNKIQVTTIFGAISANCGWVTFLNNRDTPANWYGQAVTSEGNLKVPKYSLDYLFDLLSVGELDFLHMDVQSQELNVLKGAKKCLPSIKSIFIGIHRNGDIDEIIKSAPSHKVMLCIPKANGPTVVPGYEEPIDIIADGLLVLERK